jgi:hypothetical protein
MRVGGALAPALLAFCTMALVSGALDSTQRAVSRRRNLAWVGVMGMPCRLGEFVHGTRNTVSKGADGRNHRGANLSPHAGCFRIFLVPAQVATPRKSSLNLAETSGAGSSEQADAEAKLLKFDLDQQRAAKEGGEGMGGGTSATK